MVISILTLFPEMFTGPFNYSIIKRAQEKSLVEINFVNIRDFAQDKYKTVDDRPYGGGGGMIMRIDVIDRALTFVKSKIHGGEKVKTILLDPKGKTFTQSLARDFSNDNNLIFICGHYEGIDARVETLVDEIISIGEYVLTGGEIPTMVLVDSIARLIPGVLEKPQATHTESFSENSLEAPQYTRPEIYKDMSVPKVLLSGNHAEIEKWQAAHSTKTHREK